MRLKMQRIAKVFAEDVASEIVQVRGDTQFSFEEYSRRIKEAMFQALLQYDRERNAI